MTHFNDGGGDAGVMVMYMRREVRGKSVTLSQPDLTEAQSMALERLKVIASEGREATQLEISESFCSAHPHSASKIVNRLVEKGYVERIGGPLHKSMWLRIVSTGQVTAEPSDKTPHWRFRTDRVPFPAIQRIAGSAKPMAMRIEAKARQLGKPLSEFLMDCVYVGFLTIEEEGS